MILLEHKKEEGSDKMSDEQALKEVKKMVYTLAIIVLPMVISYTIICVTLLLS